MRDQVVVKTAVPLKVGDPVLSVQVADGTMELIPADGPVKSRVAESPLWPEDANFKQDAHVGWPAQFFTKDPAQQFADMGEGPYAAVITRLMSDGYVCLRVTAPKAGFYDVVAIPPEGTKNARRWYSTDFK
jgi:hypothetical protein